MVPVERGTKSIVVNSENGTRKNVVPKSVSVSTSLKSQCREHTTPTYVGCVPVANSGVVNQIKEQIESLSKSERKEVSDHILYLNQGKAVTSTTIQDRDLAMWGESLAAELKRVTGEGTGTFPGNPTLRKLLVGGYAPVLQATTASGIDRYGSADRKMWYGLLSKLLIEHSLTIAAFVKAPVCMKFILQQTDKVPGLVENAFPGYIRAGLVGVVISRFTENRGIGGKTPG